MKGEVTWKSAVHDILGTLPVTFSLEDLRTFNDDLARQFPQNKHIDAKVRQTLQLLRDRGEVEFLGGGRYRRTNAEPRFSCHIDTSAASTYKSRSQIARVIIEPWAEHNLYCLECPSDDISALPNNTAVADLRCPVCNATYQIKSSASRMGNSILGGEYQVYRQAALDAEFPNLVLIEWDPRFSYVFVVRAIRGAEITDDRIAARKKLSDAARRKGWQGCTIDVRDLAAVGLVTPQLRDPNDCREDWRR